MKNSIFIFLFLGLSFYLKGQSQDKMIDNLFSNWDQQNTPGCALGIFKDGEIIYAKGYGFANLEYDIPNSPNSVFRIASTSKQFTAACIILLEEQGKLSLEDNLKSFFPEFPDYAEKITIQHLLNHTSGIRDYLQLSYLKGLAEEDQFTDEDVMEWLVNQKDLNFTPGDDFLYSNSGYWLLGQIVNQVSGMNMADFAKQEIFEPLGMSNTHFHNDYTQIVKNRASGYIPDRNGGYKISMTSLNMIGDGGIFTTINDIKKWDDAYYESSILSKNFWDKMTQSGVLNNGEVTNYASGLQIGEYKGLKTIRHGGSFVGFRAELLRFPEQHVSIAIFANRGDASPEALAQEVADIILQDSFENNEAENQDETVANQPKFIQLKNNALEKFSGYYWNEVSSYSRKIYVKDDTLRYSRSENNESDLVPISKNEFVMINVSANVTVQFEEALEGNKMMSVIINGGSPFYSYEYQPKEYTKAELADFVGTYYSEELDVTYKLSLDENVLMLYINDTPVSPFESIMDNLLNNAYIGTFQFERNPEGQVTGFKLASGRVKNLLFVKD